MIMITQRTTLIMVKVTIWMTWAVVAVIQLEVVCEALSWVFRVIDPFLRQGLITARHLFRYQSCIHIHVCIPDCR